MHGPLWRLYDLPEFGHQLPGLVRLVLLPKILTVKCWTFRVVLVQPLRNLASMWWRAIIHMSKGTSSTNSGKVSLKNRRYSSPFNRFAN
jgi:hypothetical protein